MSSSIRRSDLLALSRLRPDGRRPDEIRRLRVQMDVTPATTGSAAVRMGLTVVQAVVQGPLDCTKRSDERPDRATLQVAVQAAPFAPASDRIAKNAKTDRVLLQLSRQIERALEATILLHLYPQSKIEVAVTILADDGGTLPAAINACTLALVDAGIALKDLLCACSAGALLDASFSGTTASQESSAAITTLLDLNRNEETMLTAGQSTVTLPCAVLPQRGTMVLCSLSQSRVSHLDVLNVVVEAALRGCRQVFDVLQAAVRERAHLVLAAREGKAALINVYPSTSRRKDEEEVVMETD